MNALENALSNLPAICVIALIFACLYAVRMIQGHIAKNPNREINFKVGQYLFQYSDKPFQDIQGASENPVEADSPSEPTVIAERVKVVPVSGDNDASLFTSGLRQVSASELRSNQQPETTQHNPGK